MFRVAGYIVFLLVLTASVSAQPLTAFVNLQRQVMVWDDGMIRKVDYLPPTIMKIGRTAIPYLDNSRSFKIYYGGGTHAINNGFTSEFFTTDNLVAYLNASSLNVFDNGTIKNLTLLAQQYFIGDSIVLYLDGVRREYKAYYNGTIYPIENFLAADALDVIKVSDNIAAYINYSNQFRIFFHGNIIAQEDYAVSTFDVGRNTVAYVDANRQFKIFHNGQTFAVEDFPPESFSVGDNVVAYISSDGYFKIFYEDSVRTIGFFRPDYQVGDKVVAYRDGGGYFRAFYMGDITTLETYYPSGFVVQYNSVAYLNRSNVLRLFTEGEVYDVTTLYNNGEEGANENWLLSYDVLKYRVGANMYKVFYKGTEY
jgi:hypothetical protein